MNQSKNPVRYLLFSIIVIAIDQASKLLVHKYMEPGFVGQIPLIGDWLKLHYVLNPGMAFGMQLGHEYGKLFLTLFRLLAMTGIGWYLVQLAQRGAASGLLWALAMILAGAVGNVLDSTFYGKFLDNAPYGSPTPWFHGQVIDMIFVDFWEGYIPEWVPLWGGQYYSTPIFNIADASIFIGVCIILIFQSHFFKPEEPIESAEAVNEQLSEVSEESNETALDDPEVETEVIASVETIEIPVEETPLQDTNSVELPEADEKQEGPNKTQES